MGLRLEKPGGCDEEGRGGDLIHSSQPALLLANCETSCGLVIGRCHLFEVLPPDAQLGHQLDEPRQPS